MEQQGTVLDGNLETLGLQATLKMLALGGKTGILGVTSGQEHLQIALQNGQILTLEEPDVPLPDLIEAFRLLGRITRDDAAQLRQVVSAAPAGATPINAMVFMAQRRLMASEEIQKRIEFGVVQALSRAVRWERGHFEFHRDVRPLHGPMDSYKPLSVDYVLLEALRLADEREDRGSGISPIALSRFALARWIPQFQGNVAQLGLGSDAVNVLCLCNGQLSLAAIAYALMLPDQQVSTILRHLLEMRLIEIVDAKLEQELSTSLMDLLMASQYELQHAGRSSAEQRMLLLTNTMLSCTNGLLDHHKRYARSLRGRGEVNPLEVNHYIETTFGPLVTHVQREFPRMDGLIQLHEGHITAEGVETLRGVVRGQELVECYRDAMLLLSQIMTLVFERVITDEAGASRSGRQYEDLWAAFSREIDAEMTRLLGRPVGTHA